jgi:hypothetical protein
MRKQTRYVVRNRRSEELLVPSLDDLRALYQQGFLDDADQVRQERAERWTTMGQFPALHGVREGRFENPTRAGILLAALVALGAALGLLFAR